MACATFSANNSSAALGFEAKRWLAANKLRNNMDAAEYTFLYDQHPDLRADHVMANPPFNTSNWWDAPESDSRCNYGAMPQICT